MKLTALTATAALMASTTIADIQTRTVTFENEGTTMSDTLYLPEGHDGLPLPTVVVTGAWISVEEHISANYAREMVERGFAAFTLDFLGWGMSGDLPQSVRFVESRRSRPDRRF